MIWLLVFLSFVCGALAVMTFVVWAESINDFRPFACASLVSAISVLIVAAQVHG